MAPYPSDEQLKRLSYVCGMEFGKHSHAEDYFGPRIKCIAGDPEGFVTRVFLDPLRSAGSKVLPTDGSCIQWVSQDFESYDPPYRTNKIMQLVPKSFEQSCCEKREFSYLEATYAVTHTLGVVERIFLYINQPGFDIEIVIESMRLWCQRQEPLVTFLLRRSTTKS